MAGFNGRELVFSLDSTTLSGVQNKSMNMSNEMVDVTTDDDNGWRTYLANPGVKAIEVTVSGITSDETLKAEFFDANPTGETLTATLPTDLTNSGTISRTYVVGSVSYEAVHDGAYQFNATFLSSGAITYTASS